MCRGIVGDAYLTWKLCTCENNNSLIKLLFLFLFLGGGGDECSKLFSFLLGKIAIDYSTILETGGGLATSSF